MRLHQTACSNNHTTLPQFLPPDGGNAPWQTPIGAPPQGWVQNVSTGTGGLGPNHIIYLIMQGIIHSTQMALSDAGTQADVDIVTNLYQEEWWLKWLATEDPAAVWQKQWYPHNYMVRLKQSGVAQAVSAATACTRSRCIRVASSSMC